MVALQLAGCGPNLSEQAAPVGPTSSTATVMTAGVPTATGILVSLPPTTEVLAGSMLFPTAADAGSPVFTLTIQPSIPSSLGTLAKGRSPRALRVPATAGSPITLAALVVQSSQAVTFPTAPSFSFSLPAASIAASATYMFAFYDPLAAQWVLDWEGPASIAGTTLTFASNGTPLAFAANTTYTFALLEYASGVPSPSPSPSVAPSASPTASPAPAHTASPTPLPAASPTPLPTASPIPGAVLVSPATLALVAGGTPSSAPVAVSQAGQKPTFTSAAQCTPNVNTIATVSAVGASSPTSTGGAVTYTAVAGTTGGTCVVTFTSSAGGTPGTLTVTVTVTGIVLQSKSRE